jgi:hypothetical protein
MSKTNPIGAGKRNVTTTLTVEQNHALRVLAEASRMSRNEYCRQILERAISSGEILRRAVHINSADMDALSPAVRKVVAAAARRAKRKL